MIGDRVQRLAHYEDVHVILTQRDNALKDAETAEKRAEDLEVENATIKGQNARQQREIEQYARIVQSLQEQLLEARQLIPVNINTKGKT